MTNQKDRYTMEDAIVYLNRLLEAVRALDGLLLGDSNALENWSFEISNLYQAAEDVSDFLEMED